MLKRLFIATIIILFTILAVEAKIKRTYKNCAVLDVANKVQLYWTLSPDGKRAELGFSCHMQGWCAIGISSDGSMADSTVGFADAWIVDRSLRLFDAKLIGNKQPVLGEVQNLQNSSVWLEDTLLYVEFDRLLRTSDPSDREMYLGVNKFIWAGNPTSGFNFTNFSFPTHNAGGVQYYGSGIVDLTMYSNCNGTRPTPNRWTSFGGDMTVTWVVDPTRTYIDFNMTAKTLGWLGLGIAKTPIMALSDNYIAWVKDGNLTIFDAFASGPSQPEYDNIQNIEPGASGYEANGKTTVAFRRKLKTGDFERDIEIIDARLFLFFAWGVQDGDGLYESAKFSMHNNTGILQVNFLSTGLTNGSYGSITAPKDIAAPTGAKYQDPNNRFKVEFELTGSDVHILMSAKTDGWVSLGLNTIPLMQAADTFTGWINMDGTVTLRDEFAPTYNQPQLDAEMGGSGDLTVTGASFSDGWTTIQFKRPQKTMDIKDIAIGDVLYFVWAIGDEKGSDFFYPKHTAFGSVRVDMLAADPFLANLLYIRPGAVLAAIASIMLLIWTFIHWVRKGFKRCFGVEYKSKLPSAEEGYTTEPRERDNKGKLRDLPPPPPPPSIGTIDKLSHSQHVSIYRGGLSKLSSKSRASVPSLPEYPVLRVSNKGEVKISNKSEKKISFGEEIDEETGTTTSLSSSNPAPKLGEAWSQHRSLYHGTLLFAPQPRGSIGYADLPYSRRGSVDVDAVADPVMIFHQENAHNPDAYPQPTFPSIKSTHSVYTVDWYSEPNLKDSLKSHKEKESPAEPTDAADHVSDPLPPLKPDEAVTTPSIAVPSEASNDLKGARRAHKPKSASSTEVSSPLHSPKFGVRFSVQIDDVPSDPKAGLIKNPGRSKSAAGDLKGKKVTHAPMHINERHSEDEEKEKMKINEKTEETEMVPVKRAPSAEKDLQSRSPRSRNKTAASSPALVYKPNNAFKSTAGFIAKDNSIKIAEPENPEGFEVPMGKANNPFTEFIYGVMNERIPGRHFAAGDILISFFWVAFNIACLFILQDLRIATSWSFVGNALGSLLIANSVIVVILATRNSVVSFLLAIGIPMDRTVMWHRWLGRFTGILLLLHIAFQFVKWVLAGQGPMRILENLVDYQSYPSRNLYGLISALCMLLLIVTSLEVVRRKKFLYMHYFYIGYFVFSAFHHPNCVVWVIIAGVVYVLDILMRALWGIFPQKTKMIKLKEGDVVQIRFKKWLPVLHNYDVGQYLFINFPGVSIHEWHPFSVSSAPEEDELEIHVRALGDWTSKLRDRAKHIDQMWCLVDGPYGNLNLNYNRYHTLFLVAGGIGFSPVLGILKAIYLSKNPPPSRTRTVKALWMLPEAEHALWFADELKEIRAAAKDPNRPKLSLRIHITRFGSTLTDELIAGKPNMEKAYESIAEKLKSEACLTFVCGPKKMVYENWDLSVEWCRRGKRFDFHHETFDF